MVVDACRVDFLRYREPAPPLNGPSGFSAIEAVMLAGSVAFLPFWIARKINPKPPPRKRKKVRK